jgi:hypothetical protein
MKLIIAHFILYPQKDKYSARHTHRKTCDVDGRKTFVPQKVAISYLKEISNHEYINNSVKCGGQDLHKDLCQESAGKPVK